MYASCSGTVKLTYVNLNVAVVVGLRHGSGGHRVGDIVGQTRSSHGRGRGQHRLLLRLTGRRRTDDRGRRVVRGGRRRHHLSGRHWRGHCWLSRWRLLWWGTVGTVLGSRGGWSCCAVSNLMLRLLCWLNDSIWRSGGWGSGDCSAT